ARQLEFDQHLRHAVLQRLERIEAGAKLFARLDVIASNPQCFFHDTDSLRTLREQTVRESVIERSIAFVNLAHNIAGTDFLAVKNKLCTETIINKADVLLLYAGRTAIDNKQRNAFTIAHLSLAACGDNKLVGDIRTNHQALAPVQHPFLRVDRSGLHRHMLDRSARLMFMMRNDRARFASDQFWYQQFRLLGIGSE